MTTPRLLTDAEFGEVKGRKASYKAPRSNWMGDDEAAQLYAAVDDRAAIISHAEAQAKRIGELEDHIVSFLRQDTENAAYFKAEIERLETALTEITRRANLAAAMCNKDGRGKYFARSFQIIGDNAAAALTPKTQE